MVQEGTEYRQMLVQAQSLIGGVFDVADAEEHQVVCMMSMAVNKGHKIPVRAYGRHASEFRDFDASKVFHGVSYYFEGCNSVLLWLNVIEEASSRLYCLCSICNSCEDDVPNKSR